MKLFICFAYMLLLLDTVQAAPLPPLGKRKYILDVKRPERPAQIEGIESPASDLDGGMMKDPIPLGAKINLTRKEVKDPERVISKTSRMKFEKVAVGGRYSVPRVSFEKDRKEIRHADEPIKQDYKKKVQESEQILKDLNW
ncbi:MAG: hypothetical protein EOP07_17610 [Proteobacteria bacterium]|nr:MAG: hypothetical protein EOP07_17610 [Pseudomonadota bacterium]